MPGKKISKPRKERINVTYKTANKGAEKQEMLPLRLLMLGDYTGRPDERALVDRKPIKIHADNFNQTLKGQDLKLTLDNVPYTLPGAKQPTMPAFTLQFEKMEDFGPEAVAEQVPTLRTLLQLRKALVALKGPLGNMPEFRREVERILKDHRQEFVNAMVEKNQQHS